MTKNQDAPLEPSVPRKQSAPCMRGDHSAAPCGVNMDESRQPIFGHSARLAWLAIFPGLLLDAALGCDRRAESPMPHRIAPAKHSVRCGNHLPSIACAAHVWSADHEAASLGCYEQKLNGQNFPRLQIRTVRELMDGQGIERPSTVAAADETFKKAPKAKAKGHSQHEPGI